jgi:flagellar biogenesis protein FliO
MTRTTLSIRRTVRTRGVALALLAGAAITGAALAGEPAGGRESLPIGPVSAGSAGGTGASGPSTLRTVVSLAVVVALIAGGGVGVRLLARAGLAKTLGAGVGAPSGVVEVLARYPAGRGLTLVVIKVDRRVLLLGQVASTTGRVDSVSTLTTFDDADDVASLLMKTQDEEGRSISAKFREVLSGFHPGRGAAPEASEADAYRTTTTGRDGDEVALIDDREETGTPGGSLGAFRRSVGALRTSGGRGDRA